MTNFILEQNKHLDFQIDTAIKCENVNSYINQFEWYITPFFYQDQYSQIIKFRDSGTGTKEKITDVMKKTLFDSRILAIYMEAFYKKLPYLKDFSFHIDHGIILYLQSDYLGSINTLIPVIEGVIRKYLVTKGNNSPSFRNLKDSFDLMKNDIIESKKIKYIGIGLTELNYNPLLNKYNVFLTKWFSFIKDFIENGMYLDTRVGTPPDLLNRHLILHGLTNDIYYNFSNTMKTYISIQYLAWIFIQLTDGFHTVPDIKEEEYSERDLLYEKINHFSNENLTEIKHSLYKSHSQYILNNYFK